jgi:hypothetical protein
MNKELKLLAENMSIWPEHFYSCAWDEVMRKGHELCGWPESTLSRPGLRHRFTRKEWQAARIELGLDSPFTSPEEDEAWAEREAHINAIARNGEPAIEYTRTAEQFLSQAADLLIERGKQYDKPCGERSMGSTVKAFNAITNKTLSESEGWLFMSILKRVRQFQGPYHKDSAEDAVSYSALEAEALERGL